MFTEYTTHYKSVFFVQPHKLTTQEDAWQQALGNIYGWLIDNVQRQLKGTKYELFSRQAFACTSPDGKPWEKQGLSIRTQCSGEDSPPKFWACRYEHPDSSQQARRWRTDVGIECMPDFSLRVGVRVAHCLRDDYMGAPPVAPDPSVPRAIRYIMQGDNWDVRLGSLRLSTNPRIYGEGEVKQLWDALRDPNRGGPVVLVTANYQGEYPLNLRKLSERLTGIAEVCGLPYETQEEQKHTISAPYQCFPNSARVYRQGLDIQQVKDSQRHRFFSNSQIQQEGPDQIIQWIVRSLVHQATLTQPQALFSPGDIDNLQRTERLEYLRQQVERLHSGNSQLDAETKEYYSLLDQENTSLKSENKALIKANKVLDNNAFAADVDKEAAEAEIERLTYELTNGYGATQVNRLHEENNKLKTALSVVDSLDSLPTDLREAAELAATIWPDRIVFTSKALSSADDSLCQDVDELWFGLYHMAHTLWDLYFNKPQSFNAIKASFDSTAGSWELTHGEGKMTNKDAKFKRHRQGEFEGIDLELDSHIKLGSKRPEHLLRVHFHKDDENRRLIIGHCGNHLPNYSSQKQ